jgi:predicted permease
MRQDVNEALNKTTKLLAAHGWKTRGFLVVSEVSLALVLLVGAGLMARSLLALYRVDLGFFRPDHLLTAHVNLPMRLPGSRYQKPESVSAFCDQLLERLRNLSGVESATLASALPSEGGGFYVSSFSLPGESRDNYSAGVSSVGAGYFETVGTRILRGRTFTPQEIEQESDAIIVNQALAASLWPNQDPIGKVIVHSKPRTIIGVAEDTHMWGLDQPPKPEIYMPAKSLASFSVILRTLGDPRSLVSSLTSQVLAVDKDMPVEGIQTMREALDDSLLEPRFRTWLFMAFAGLAMSLAAIGLYGVLAYSVNQRIPEIGIRMALGADAQDVLALVVRQGMVFTFWGICLGLFAAFSLSRLMSSLVFGIKTTDPLTFISMAGTLMIVAALASYIPARRATRVDPIVALRCE